MSTLTAKLNLTDVGIKDLREAHPMSQPGGCDGDLGGGF